MGKDPQTGLKTPVDEAAKQAKPQTAADSDMPAAQSADFVPNESHYHSKKNRTFVRAIAGAYNLKDEMARLRAMPRVRKGSEIKFNDGPQTFSRHYVQPKDGITQTFHIHLEEYGPGGHSQKHGHVNEAAFYILDGIGYEIHDGIRYDWKAGDVAIVHNNCVHQHFNASPDKPARALVIKTKPMYMFMNMLFQHQVEPRPSEPAGPAGVGFQARMLEDDFNHPEGGY
jgi:quercetin dioxygenase-like cupin family protein